MKINLEVRWRYSDEQGKEFVADPTFTPHISHEIIYTDFPLLESQIESIIRKFYLDTGKLIEINGITILKAEK